MVGIFGLAADEHNAASRKRVQGFSGIMSASGQADCQSAAGYQPAPHSSTWLRTAISCGLIHPRIPSRLSIRIDGDMIGSTGDLMKAGFGVVAAACIFMFTESATAQTAAGIETPTVSLTVPSGAPLRLYLTKRISKRTGAPVEAKLMEPVFAFDREVIPAGTVAQGRVSRVQPVGKWQRVRAIISGDFTPLRSAQVEFTTLVLPDGHTVSTHTVETAGLNSLYIEPSKKKKQKAQPPNQNGGILGAAKQTATDRINGAINARSQGIADIVRGPNKKEKLTDLMWSKLPYHPQYVRRGTRFDASLREPLQFGVEPVKREDLDQLGSQPLPDSVAHVRLLTALNSASAKQGEAVEAVVVAPLFSADHKLVFPEGTRLSGTVVVAKKARYFHRGGQLRFNFQTVDLPFEAANLRPAAPTPEPMKTQAILAGAEGNGTAPIKVDSEGGVEAKESKTRFISPVIALILATRASDNDHHHDADDTGATAGGKANVSGRTLGGGLGLGMLGAALSQSSPYVGMAFGYYGLAWSVYSNVIARGAEVQFDKNAMMDIKFGARTPPKASKFRALAEGLVH